MKNAMTMGLDTAQRYLEEGRRFDAGAMLGRLVPIAAQTGDGETLNRINAILHDHLDPEHTHDMDMSEATTPEALIGGLLDVARETDDTMNAGLAWGQARTSSLLHDCIMADEVEATRQVLIDE